MSAYGLPGSKAAALREAVHKLLLAHEERDELPTSNRFLFYELVQLGVLDKTKTRQTGRGDDQNLSDASKWLRDEGVVPWDWIVDETRSLTQWAYAASVAEYVRSSVWRARIDRWAGAPPFTARSLTETGAEEMYQRARRYTPVRSGAVRAAWQTTPVERHGLIYEARVQNHHWRAHWAEWGTGPHVIEPEDKEAIETPQVLRARAHHPGYPGAHMLARAAHEVEFELRALAQDERRAWAEAAVANARRRPGIS